MFLDIIIINTSVDCLDITELLDLGLHFTTRKLFLEPSRLASQITRHS